jgi:hypothetical protein
MTIAVEPLRLTITDSLRSKHLFAPFFFGASWNRWKAVLKAAYAEPLTTTELELLREVADRDPPKHRVKTLACIVGRGGGKDATASFCATFAAMTFDPKVAKLRPGELAYVMCLACDKDQAGIVFKYIRALFEAIPTLQAMVKNIGSDSIELRNRVTIQVTTNSYRSIRGRSILCAIFDEVSFWRDDTARSANPDSEVAGAISPGLARVPNSMLIMISSAHRRSGILYERWKSFFGKPDNDTLVVRGTTTQFNSTFDQAIIDAELARDGQRFSAEYNSEWRDDLSSFLDLVQLERCIHRGVAVKPPIDGIHYFAFNDPSSGRGDAFTACIAHHEMNNGVMRVVIDAIYIRYAPFDPSVAVAEVAQLLKSYRCHEVTGDDYAKGFVEESFRKLGIRYVSSKLNRSEIYLTFLPLVMAGQVLLLDHTRSIAEFAALERRAVPSGRDIVDHPNGAHDDTANSIAGAAVLASYDREQRIPHTAPIIITRGDLLEASDVPNKTTEFYAASGGPVYWGTIGTRGGFP